MNKLAFENFVKIKGFKPTHTDRLDNDRYAILLTDNIVQIFEKMPVNVEDYIIREQPPKIVDTYCLENVELKDGKIKRKEVVNGS